ncbi:hypothetical protein ABE137_03655 [Brevibacillus laterosporus]|uniref:hypothetical protein n=1 Tax=Brevibacillus laterosporus TaxID=1465 RepID=UPI003D239734
MFSLKQVKDGKKIAFYMDNTPEYREQMLLITNAIFSGELTQITTLNKISELLTTHLAYCSDKFEWQERRALEQERTINELVKLVESLTEQKPAVAAKRKAGRPSRKQLELWERQYDEIVVLHRQWAKNKGYDVDNQNSMAHSWNTMHHDYRDASGYWPAKKDKHPAFGSRQATRLMTTIFDGEGEGLIQFLRSDIGKRPSSSKEVTLRLNIKGA